MTTVTSRSATTNRRRRPATRPSDWLSARTTSLRRVSSCLMPPPVECNQHEHQIRCRLLLVMLNVHGVKQTGTRRRAEIGIVPFPAIGRCTPVNLGTRYTVSTARVHGHGHNRHFGHRCPRDTARGHDPWTRVVYTEHTSSRAVLAKIANTATARGHGCSIHTARVHGPWTPVSFFDTLVHWPRTRAVDTSSVYRALVARTATSFDALLCW